MDARNTYLKRHGRLAVCLLLAFMLLNYSASLIWPAYPYGLLLCLVVLLLGLTLNVSLLQIRAQADSDICLSSKDQLRLKIEMICYILGALSVSILLISYALKFET